MEFSHYFVAYDCAYGNIKIMTNVSDEFLVGLRRVESNLLFYY